jgi:PAS domain S-box-containing protein
MSSTPLRVLLVEDQEDEALRTQALLESLPGTPATCDWVATADAGFEALLTGGHDVCLLDYVLDGAHGTDVLRRARARAVHTPVILLTGKGSRDVDLEAMEAGAVDYLEKGTLDPKILERTLRYAVERHRGMQELRESEERNRGMFDHLPLGLFRVSMDGTYLEANPALVRILEQPDLDYLQGTLSRHFFVAPSDQPRLLRALEETGEVTGFESRVLSGRGRTIQCRVHARVHRNPTGEAEYVEGAVEDLTGSPAAHRLEEDAASFAALASVGDLGLVRIDPDGRVRWVNEATARMLGERAVGLVGEGVWTLVHPEDQDRVARAFEEITAGTRDRTSRDLRTLHPDGSPHPVRLTLVAVTGPAGALRSVLGLFAEPAPASAPRA